VGVQSSPKRLFVRVRLIIDEEAAVHLKTLNYTALWLASAAAAALCAPGSAFAQAAPAPDEAGSAAATAVAQVVVTANRSVTPADRVGQSVTVLTSAQIQLDQETSVSDILGRTPGINVVRNGGPGETTSVFIRGAESAQTVVMVDGVKLNDPTDPGAGYDFASLTTGDISRIEVLRGPQSTLYGSEAIGGVVNILTAGATKPLEADLRVEGGSYGETYANGGVGGKEDKFDWRISGYSNQAKSVPCFDGGNRPCAYHMAGVSGRFRYDLTPNLQFDQRAYYSWSRADFDGYDTPNFEFGDDQEYGHVQQWIDYTGLNLSLFDGRLKNRLAYEYSAIDRNNQDPGQPANLGVPTTTTFVAHGRTSTVEYEGTFAIAPGWQAVFGAQSERSSLYAFSPAFQAAPDEAHQTLNSGYAQLSGEVLPGLTLTAGGRYDDQTRVGDHLTGQASAAWRLNGGNTILRASFGQGFKAPSLYQLYSEYGNLGLRPEEANGWDLGVEQHFLDGRVVVQATYFGRDTKNLIEFVSCWGSNDPVCANYPSGGYYKNVNRAKAQGVELQGSWKVTDRLTFSANYTYDDSEDQSPGSLTKGNQLARRPKNTANLDAGYEWPIKLRTDVAVRYAGDSWNDDAHTRLLKAYTLVDLRASYPLREGVELYGRIENLADEHYETAYQYGTLGRAAYGGVRLKY
jgi:vitamin B12 transporter